MASRHTERFGLNLWEPGDSVLREEFNENTEKIDAALASKGNCYIVTGSYTGDGRYGEKTPNTLTFPGKPLLVIINQGGFFVAVSGSTKTYGYTQGGSVTNPTLTWEGNSLSWSFYYDAAHQLNTSGTVYHYIALIAAD